MDRAYRIVSLQAVSVVSMASLLFFLLGKEAAIAVFFGGAVAVANALFLTWCMHAGAQRPVQEARQELAWLVRFRTFFDGRAADSSGIGMVETDADTFADRLCSGAVDPGRFDNIQWNREINNVWRNAYLLGIYQAPLAESDFWQAVRWYLGYCAQCRAG